MGLTRKEESIQDITQPSTDVEIEDKARIKLKGKSAKASAKRNRSPGRLAPAPVSKANSSGKYE